MVSQHPSLPDRYRLTRMAVRYASIFAKKYGTLVRCLNLPTKCFMCKLPTKRFIDFSGFLDEGINCGGLETALVSEWLEFWQKKSYVRKW